MAKSNLTLRLASAAVALPPLVLLLYRGPPWGFFLVVILFQGLAARELFRMTHPDDALSRGIGLVSTIGMSLSVYHQESEPRLLISAVLALVAVGALTPLFRLGDLPSAGLRIMTGIAGPIYLGASLATLALVRRDFPQGPGWVVLILMYAWLADTGGYFFGRFLGKTPLYPAVSPKKTRAGFVGALIGAASSAAIARFSFLPDLDLLHALLLGVVAGALGQLGDLVESLLKRSTGIKDSGSLVPGHGGVLDRVDAVLLVAPLVYLYLLWAVA